MVVAQERVMQGEVSRARQAQTGAALAPGTPKEAISQPIPPDVMVHSPDTCQECLPRHFRVRPE